MHMLLLSLSQSVSRRHKRFRLKERVLLRHVWVTDVLALTGLSSIPDRGGGNLVLSIEPIEPSLYTTIYS